MENLQDRFQKENRNCDESAQTVDKNCAGAGMKGIASDRLAVIRENLHFKLQENERERQRLLEALRDTEDETVQRVIRIISLA